jgi:hypothetical protein
MSHVGLEHGQGLDVAQRPGIEAFKRLIQQLLPVPEQPWMGICA